LRLPFVLRPTSGCELARGSLSEYLNGGLSAPEREWLSAHLVSCAACREQLESLRLTVRLLHDLPQVPVPRSFLVTVPEPRPAGFLPTLGVGTLGRATAAVGALFAVVLAASVALQGPVPATSRYGAPAVTAGASASLAQTTPLPAAAGKSPAMAPASPTAVKPAATAAPAAAPAAVKPTEAPRAAEVPKLAAAPAAPRQPLTATPAEPPKAAMPASAPTQPARPAPAPAAQPSGVESKPAASATATSPAAVTAVASPAADQANAAAQTTDSQPKAERATAPAPEPTEMGVGAAPAPTSPEAGESGKRMLAGEAARTVGPAATEESGWSTRPPTRESHLFGAGLSGLASGLRGAALALGAAAGLLALATGVVWLKERRRRTPRSGGS